MKGSHKDAASHGSLTHANIARKKPCVLIATPYFPPHVGGVENYVYNIGRILVQRHGWRVVIVTSNTQNKRSTVTEEEGMRVYRLPYYFRISNTPFSLGWHRAFRRIIEAERPDIVNAHSPVPFVSDVAAVAAGDIPFIATYHTGGTVIRRGLLLDALTRIYESSIVHHMLRRADHVISSSEFVRQTFLNKYRAKTTTITPGVDLELFRPRGQKEQPHSVLFVGSLKRAERYKGLEFLLAALAHVRKRFPNAHLHVVGDGDFRYWYERRARELGISANVTFHGRLQGRALADAYAHCAVFVHPSLFDSCPLVVLEAMASGKPVIGTDASGIPYIVRDRETGLLFPPKDDHALAARITDLFTNPTEARRLAKAGHTFITEYSWDAQAARTNRLFHDAVPSIGRTRPAVTFLSPYYAPHIGGVENYVEAIATRLSERWDVSVITTISEPNSPQWEKLRGITVYRLPTGFKLSNTPIGLTWRRQIKRIFAREKPDVTNGHSPVPVLAEIGAYATPKGRFILTYHSGTMRKRQRLPDLAIGFYERFVLPYTLKRAHRVACSSDFVRTRFLDGIVRDKKKLVTITPGFDRKVFYPKGKAMSATVLFVGRLEKHAKLKGVDVLLRAMRIVQQQVPRASIVFVGGGDSIDVYKEIGRNLGLTQMQFDGSQPVENLRKRYQEATVLILPSTTDTESFGTVIVEAAACGTPSIGSDVGGIPFVIEHERTGLIVPPSDEEALAAAIVRVLTNAGLRQRLGHAAHALAMDRYQWDSKARQYEQVFTEAMR